MSDQDDTIYCQRCGRVLNPNEAKWLELNFVTNLYAEPGSVPPDQSQGGFSFGKDCATKVLSNGGHNDR
jgi:hypothetical protein